MQAADSLSPLAPGNALPGVGRTLVTSGKLGQKFAEDIYRKAQANRSSFIAELTGSGAVSAADLAHTLSLAFGTPQIDLAAVDPQRLPDRFARLATVAAQIVEQDIHQELRRQAAGLFRALP